MKGKKLEIVFIRPVSREVDEMKWRWVFIKSFRRVNEMTDRFDSSGTLKYVRIDSYRP